MKLSIIIPLYNVEEYITECLASIVPLQDAIELEVILIDDGSTDNSPTIALKSKHLFKNFSLVTQVNSGVSVARNEGILRAQGQYLYFMDSDDILIPEEFISFFKSTEENDLDIASANGYLLESQTKKKIKSDSFRKNAGIISGTTYYLKSLKARELAPMVWLHLYKREFILKNKIEFLKGVSLHEDDAFFVTTFSLAKKVSYFPNFFYLYRVREQSAINRFGHKYLDERGTNCLIAILNYFGKIRKGSLTHDQLEVIQIAMTRLLKDLLERYIYYKKRSLSDLENKWLNSYQSLEPLHLPLRFHRSIFKYWAKFYFLKLFKLR